MQGGKTNEGDKRKLKEREEKIRKDTRRVNRGWKGRKSER